MTGRFTPKVSAAEALQYHEFHCCEGSVEVMCVMSGIDPERVNLNRILRDMRADCPACRRGDLPDHAQHLDDEC